MADAPPVALIAGAGRFPAQVAQSAKRHGARVLILGIKGWADPALAAVADSYQEIELGQIGAVLRTLAAHRVRQAIMAGKVTKDVLLDSRTAFDAEALAILAAAPDRSVPAVLGGIAARLAKDGVTLMDSSTFLQDDLCPPGVLTARQPSPGEQEDIRIGVEAARALATVDIGQTVLVKARVIVAVEALEGTDAAIRRAHQLAGDGLTLIKTGARQQDRRFDLPVIGADTLAVCAASGVACIAVESGATVLLDRAALVRDANARRLTVIGVPLPAAS